MKNIEEKYKSKLQIDSAAKLKLKLKGSGGYKMLTIVEAMKPRIFKQLSRASQLTLIKGKSLKEMLAEDLSSESEASEEMRSLIDELLDENEEEEENN